jgi:tripartite-type tricarboxylate transporter receptor subunit TctC
MDGLSDGADILCKALAMNCKVVLGYTGTSDAALALGRGEMDALITNEASANSFVGAKNALPVASLSTKRSRYFPNVPTIYQAAKLSPDARWWIDFRVNTDILGRVIAAPPGMPPARLKALQNAVRQSLTDPQLIADGAKSKHFVEFQDAKDIHETVLKVLEQTSAAEKNRIRQVVKAD